MSSSPSVSPTRTRTHFKEEQDDEDDSLNGDRPSGVPLPYKTSAPPQPSRKVKVSCAQLLVESKVLVASTAGNDVHEKLDRLYASLKAKEIKGKAALAQLTALVGKEVIGQAGLIIARKNNNAASARSAAAPDPEPTEDPLPPSLPPSIPADPPIESPAAAVEPPSDAPSSTPLARVGPLDVHARLRHAAAKGDSEAIRALLAAGADVEARDKNGYTPLMLASLRGDAATVLLLLDLGANLDATSSAGKSASELAKKQGHRKIVRALDAARKLALIEKGGGAAARKRWGGGRGKAASSGGNGGARRMLRFNSRGGAASERYAAGGESAEWQAVLEPLPPRWRVYVSLALLGCAVATAGVTMLPASIFGLDGLQRLEPSLHFKPLDGGCRVYSVHYLGAEQQAHACLDRYHYNFTTSSVATRRWRPRSRPYSSGVETVGRGHGSTCEATQQLPAQHAVDETNVSCWEPRVSSALPADVVDFYSCAAADVCVVMMDPAVTYVAAVDAGNRLMLIAVMLAGIGLPLFAIFTGCARYGAKPTEQAMVWIVYGPPASRKVHPEIALGAPVGAPAGVGQAAGQVAGQRARISPSSEGANDEAWREPQSRSAEQSMASLEQHGGFGQADANAQKENRPKKVPKGWVPA